MIYTNEIGLHNWNWAMWDKCKYVGCRPDKERPLKVVLVATKSDLPSQRHQVASDTGESWANANGLDFFTVSSVSILWCRCMSFNMSCSWSWRHQVWACCIATISSITNNMHQGLSNFNWAHTRHTVHAACLWVRWEMSWLAVHQPCPHV